MDNIHCISHLNLLENGILGYVTHSGRPAQIVQMCE